MKIMLPLAVVLFALLLLSGCVVIEQRMTSPSMPSPVIETVETISVEEACIRACEQTKGNIENGPCLLNPIENTEWVCDVAHSPRIDIDNQPENQCSAFREGKARHFVEVSIDCIVIKKV
ncbi:MAG TPA: hypothetical protein HA362_05335 [Nanoarchaeota archaeon]|nr:hypothetical protein [Nanoarchaeota archaeon]